MEDDEIIELYFARSESAIKETHDKYGRYCFFIANNILGSDRDAEECVSDAYLSLWNEIPPQRPVSLKAFAGKITRNIALDRYDFINAEKRSPKCEAVFDEFYECMTGKSFSYDDELILKESINKFLSRLSERKRIMFLQRYWYFCSIKEIADMANAKENYVKVTLFRLRRKFKDFLIKEGVLT